MILCLIFLVIFVQTNQEVCKRCQEISGGKIYPQELRSHGTHNLHISKARSTQLMFFIFIHKISVIASF